MRFVYPKPPPPPKMTEEEESDLKGFVKANTSIVIRMKIYEEALKKIVKTCEEIGFIGEDEDGEPLYHSSYYIAKSALGNRLLRY